MKLSKKKQFFVVLASFLILAIPFKVMVLIEGFTEVRPVNAIPPVAGLICGPVGAVACGLGNLIADLFGTFNLTSLLGCFGNMAAAYLPYRMWHIYSTEPPNLHKNRNILLYIFLSLAAALTVAWFLAFGLYFFFGQWMESIYTYVFWNNFGFSIGFGMPLFIMLSSDGIAVECARRPAHFWILRREKLRKAVPIVYTVVMAILWVCVCVWHASPAGNVLEIVLSVLGAAGLVMILV